MMTLYHAFVLGILQGLTEFLPISSSGHLVLLEHGLNLTINPAILQRFDIALHGGSLVAILLYFSKTWIELLSHPFRRQRDGHPPLLLLILVATIPLALTGVFGGDWVEANTRTPIFVAFGFIFTGAFLIISAWFESRFAARESIGWQQVIGAGFGQALAIFPGFSRAGLTIASGRLMGLSVRSATTLAFLLGAPALCGALLYAFKGDVDILSVGLWPLVTGFGASFLSSILVMHIFLRTIRRFGVWPWSLYLFAAAALLLADEMLPLIVELPHIIQDIDMRVVAGVIFIALLLESAPFTSFFVPGFTTLIAVVLFLRTDPIHALALIPIGAVGVILGQLLGYIPARQARRQIRWKSKTDAQLTQAEHFFHRWGILSVFLGVFLQPIRPWMSIVAGFANMRPLPYLCTMIAGSLIFVGSIVITTLFAGDVLASFL